MLPDDKLAENNLGALQIKNFEKGDWAQGYVIEDTGEIDSSN